MIRVDIESIIMAAGPVPSVIVLRERKGGDASSDTPLRALSIQTGTYEAAAIGHGIDMSKQFSRPLAHDLLLNTIKELGAKIERVEINRWDAPVFYADVVLEKIDDTPDGEQREYPDAQTRGDVFHGRMGEIKLDARPSDALALATRANAPIYVEDDVMNRAGSFSHQSDEQPSDEELERFDAFVQTLSPDDF